MSDIIPRVSREADLRNFSTSIFALYTMLASSADAVSENTVENQSVWEYLYVNMIIDDVHVTPLGNALVTAVGYLRDGNVPTHPESFNVVLYSERDCERLFNTVDLQTFSLLSDMVQRAHGLNLVSQVLYNAMMREGSMRTKLTNFAAMYGADDDDRDGI